MIRVKAPSIGHVVQDVTARQAIPGDRAKKSITVGGRLPQEELSKGFT